MLLLPYPQTEALATSQFPVFAELTAIGEPRRRSWSATYSWDLRAAKVVGTGELSSVWLSKLLDQLALIEYLVVKPHVGTPGLSETEYWQMHVYYTPTLRTSVRNTIKRYCRNHLWMQPPQ